MIRTRLLLPALLLLAATASAQDVPFDRLGDMVDAVRPAAVRVEFSLRFDRGEPPRSLQSSGVVDTIGGDDGASLIRQERPLEHEGILVAERSVVTMDPMVHPRFVRDIRVRQGDRSVVAHIDRYTKSHHGLILRLEAPLDGARPLRFDAASRRPWYGVSLSLGEDKLYLSASPLWPRLYAVPDGKPSMDLGPLLVVLDARGVAAGVSLGHAGAIDGPWRGSPLERAAVSAAELDGALASLETRVNRGVVRVRLEFRSPKADDGPSFRWGGDDSDTATEQNVPGILLPEGRVLVLADMAPKQTFRLEKIGVAPAGGELVEATFESSLKYDGAFLAKLAAPLEGAIELAADEIEAYDGRLLLAADVRIEGEARTAFYQRCGFGSLQVGWRRRLRPAVSGASGALFLFDLEGRLVALPLDERDRVSGSQGGWRHRWNSSLLASETLRATLADPAQRTDPANVPSPDDAERPVAWLGVILQPLDRDLARVNGVSHLTRDGQTGALVSFVYPDSPAARAGIEPGSVLLRIEAEGYPVPIEVSGAADAFGFDFPPNMPAAIRRQMLGQMGATPWPSVDAPFTSILTDLGPGTPCVVELWQGGELVRKPFTVELGPPQYAAAPRFKSAALDMTVRDLTFEVRHYFQLGPDDPGVIVSKVEEGGKAAVAEIGPFELITQVDDRPIRSVKEFEEAIRGGGEKRFTVRYRTQTRLVKVLLPETEKKETDATPAGGGD